MAINVTGNDQKISVIPIMMASILPPKYPAITPNTRPIKSENPSTPLKGIASYSKIYSIIDMDKYAVYDARVAAALNAIQWNYGVKDGMAFNYINVRNNIIGNATKKIGFVYQEPFKVKNLVAKGWRKIRKDDTYQVYLDLLQTCLKQLPKYNLYELEMVLFANAEKECENK